MFGMNLDAIWAYAQSNQFLIGGIGTVLTGSILYFCRRVPMTIYDFFHAVCTIEVEVNNQFPLYSEIVRLLAKHRISLFSRNYSIDERKKATAGYGKSVAFYKNRLVIFNRTNDSSKNFHFEKLKVTIFSRNKNIFQSMINDAKTDTDMNVLSVYTLSGGYGWSDGITRAKRSLDTVFLPFCIKNEIVETIEWFQNNRDWYNLRGLNYKLVFLFHGPPGTGKSSLIRALASHFDYKLGVCKDLNDLQDNLIWAPERSFVVIEDIDALGTMQRDQKNKLKKRKYGNHVINVLSDEDEEKQDFKFDSQLHQLLQVLDGLNTPEGSIIFITTNHIDKLDQALIRPGRVDHCIEIGPLEYEDMLHMFKSFYGRDPGRYSIRYDTPLVGAKLQEIFMRYSEEEAIRVLNGDVSEPMDVARKAV